MKKGDWVYLSDFEKKGEIINLLNAGDGKQYAVINVPGAIGFQLRDVEGLQKEMPI